MNHELRGRLPENLLLADGLDDALHAVMFPIDGSAPVAVYDRARCIEILQDANGWDDDEAEAFFQFNVEAGYIGPQTPLYLELELEHALERQG